LLGIITFPENQSYLPQCGLLEKTRKKKNMTQEQSSISAQL
jgi:hypothetical protein